MTDEDCRAVERDVRRKQRQWHDLDELADKMLARAAAGKNVVLSPGTAEVVANAIRDLTNRTD